VRVPRNPYAQPGDYAKKKLAAVSVLHMAQEIVSRHKHNMLSLLYATCLKLLVFFNVNLDERRRVDNNNNNNNNK
jgi:hypothetical protein